MTACASLVAALAALLRIPPTHGNGCSLCPEGQEPTKSIQTEEVYTTSGGNVLQGTCMSLACAVASEENDCSFYESNNLHVECCMEEEEICTLCADGSGVPGEYEHVPAYSWQTCGQLYHSAPFLGRNKPMQCALLQVIGHETCGCPTSPPLGSCSVCPSGDPPSDPDVIADGHGRHSCGELDVLSRIAAHRDPDHGCSAFQSLYGPGCCPNEISPPQTCPFPCPEYLDFFPHQDVSNYMSSFDGNCLDLYTALQADSDTCEFYSDAAQSYCCMGSLEGDSSSCDLCRNTRGINGTASVEFNGTIANCTDIQATVYHNSDQCDDLRTDDIVDACCLGTPCDLCPYIYTDLKWWQTVDYNGETGTTCEAVNETLHLNAVDVGSDECNDVGSNLSDECCYQQPLNPCRLCDFYTKSDDTKVTFDGRSNVTCADAQSILDSVEFHSCTCLDAQDALASECCFETPCGFCSGSSIRYEATVDEFENDVNVTCGALSSVGYSIETGTEQCNNLQSSAVTDACCYDQCYLCKENSSPNWSVSVDVHGETVTCGTLHYSNGFEAGTSQCSDIQRDHCDACCAECDHVEVDVADDNEISDVTPGIHMKVVGIGIMSPGDVDVYEKQTEKYIEEYYSSGFDADVSNVNVTIQVTNQTAEDDVGSGSSSGQRSLEMALEITYTQMTTYRTSDPNKDISEIIEAPFDTAQKQSSYIETLKDQGTSTVFESVQSVSPVAAPSAPTGAPLSVPSEMPTSSPSGMASMMPSSSPTIDMPEEPSGAPSETPSEASSDTPSGAPSHSPSEGPSTVPSTAPTATLSGAPSKSNAPSNTLSIEPSHSPIEALSDVPSASPSVEPTRAPETSPTSDAKSNTLVGVTLVAWTLSLGLTVAYCT